MRAFYIKPEAAATGEIIYELIAEYLQIPLSLFPMAANLYAALAGDTGTFRYSNTNSRVLYIASELVRQGADPAETALHL